MTRREAIEKRLDSYWKLELGNVILVPVTMVYVAHALGSPIGWLSGMCIVPMAGLLAIGGLYWRGKLKAIQFDKSELDRALLFAHVLQGPLIILTSLALLAMTIGWILPGYSVGLGDRIVATIAAVLALLEYINYYHRQVQHFDHPSDWQRLIAGDGFRPSQMSVDLRQWRRLRSASTRFKDRAHVPDQARQRS
ncbi:MAG: hypothetical protein AAFX02_03440 [Pseudomonadota bacterium]